MQMGRSVAKVVVTAVVVFACCSVAPAQYHQTALERAREIRFLQDDRETVRRLFHDWVLDYSGETTDDFSLGDTMIDFIYSTGKCDESDDEVWNAPKGAVIRIEITSEPRLKLEDFAKEISGLTKEKMFGNVQERFIYHDKVRGIAFESDGDDIEKLTLFPSVKVKNRPCEDAHSREFVSEKSWFGKKELKDRKFEIHEGGPANVTGLTLSRELLDWSAPRQVEVEAIAVDPENDVLTFNYFVSAGRIVGEGRRVVWDLSGVKPGTYTITAGVDDGCGLCGRTATKIIVIK